MSLEIEIATLIKSTHPHKFRIISENKEMIDYLNNKFPMLNFSDNPREMGYLIKNNQSEPDRCKNPKCNKYLKFTEKKVLYRKIVCDNKCMHEKHRELGSYEEINKKRTDTSLKNYGTSHPMKNDAVKKKLEETFLKNYGETHPLKVKAIKEKASDTLFKRVGVRHPSQMADFKEKTEATNLDRHGFEWVTKNPKVIAAREETCLKKYGVVDVQKRHMSSETVEILGNMSYLQKLVNEYGVKRLSVILGVMDKTIYDKQKNGLILPPYVASRYEGELKEFLDENNISYIHGDRTILKPKELDFYFPDQKLAVEICGLYWHSEKQGKDKKYHYNKWKECKDKGIQLLTIFEDEIVNRRDFWYNKILNELNMTNNTKIAARKCKIVSVTQKIAAQFLDDNHLQGKAPFRYSIGLEYNNELVSIMTFSNTRGNEQGVLDLNRFCNKLGYTVQGGASKLLKNFIVDISSDTKKIISFSDNRYSSGKIYDALGFRLDSTLSPDYSYIVGPYERTHKASFRKNAIQVKFDLTEEYVSSKTERELMEEMGIERIWDCGKVKWSLSV